MWCVYVVCRDCEKLGYVQRRGCADMREFINNQDGQTHSLVSDRRCRDGIAWMGLVTQRIVLYISFCWQIYAARPAADTSVQ